MDDMILVLLVALFAAAGTKAVDYYFGLGDIKRSLAENRRETLKVKHELGRVVRCLRKTNQEFNEVWEEDLAEAWLKKTSNGNGNKNVHDNT